MSVNKKIHAGDPDFDSVSQGKSLANLASAIEMGYIIAGVEYETTEIMEKAFELYIQLMPRGYTIVPNNQKGPQLV